MKIPVTIFLLALMALVQTPAGQLLKLPLLVEHFMKHQRQDGVSLLDFLNDHYSPGHKDADLPEDEQLPFKSITFSTVICAVVPGMIGTQECHPLAAGKKIIFRKTHTPQSHSGSIFHPPRA